MRTSQRRGGREIVEKVIVDRRTGLEGGRFEFELYRTTADEAGQLGGRGRAFDREGREGAGRNEHYKEEGGGVSACGPRPLWPIRSPLLTPTGPARQRSLVSRHRTSTADDTDRTRR